MKIIKLFLGAIFVVAIVACYFYSCVDSSWGRHKTSLEWTIETQPYND